MKIQIDNEIIEALTIKELYEIAVAQGKENAIIGISYEDTDTGYCSHCDERVGVVVEYIEEVRPTDIEFGGYYHNGNKEENKICDCVWLNNHEL